MSRRADVYLDPREPRCCSTICPRSAYCARALAVIPQGGTLQDFSVTEPYMSLVGCAAFAEIKPAPPVAQPAPRVHPPIGGLLP